MLFFFTIEQKIKLPPEDAIGKKLMEKESSAPGLLLQSGLKNKTFKLGRQTQ